MFGRMHFGKVSSDLSGICHDFSHHYSVIFFCLSFSFSFLFLTKVYFVILRAVDHQLDGGYFATAGAQVDIWNHNRFSSQLVLKTEKSLDKI